MPENETPDVDTEVVDLDQADTPAEMRNDYAPETDAEHQGDTDGEDNGKDGLPEDHEEDGPGREAKKYRLRLREAEARVTDLETRVEALQRAEVDRIATAAGVKPAALWASGAELPALLTETGTVDPAAVDTAIKTARESLGLPDRRKNIVPQEGRNPQPPRTPGGIDGMVRTVMGRTEQ